MPPLYAVTDQRTRHVIAGHVRCARSFSERLVGLIGRRDLFPGEGLWLPRCGSIHTWFMSFPIDVLFMDAGYAVIAAEAELPPWRVRRASAVHILELPAGTLSLQDIRVGDRLEFSSHPVTV